MNHATIDFETKSACDIKWGAWRYSEDPSTDVLCLKFKVPGRSEIGLWTPFFEDFEEGSIKYLIEWIENGGLVEAHNAGFEEAIWQNQMHRKYKFPQVNPTQWRCSAAKASALALPRSLEGVGSALGLPIQKNMEGRRLMLKMSKPKRPTKAEKEDILKDPDVVLRDDGKTFYHDPSDHEFHIWNEKPEDYIKLFDYCDTDVVTEEMASARLLPLSDKELKVWQLDQEINRRGIYCDEKLIKKSLSFIDRYAKTLVKELREISGGAIQTPNQRAKILCWLEDQGFPLEGLTARHVSDALEDDFLEDNVRRVLEIRQALSKSSTKKLQAMLSMAGEGSRIRGTLLYHGASTGRWAGRGIQPQNLPRGNVKDVESCIRTLEKENYATFTHKYPDVLDAVSSCIRGMLCASPGNRLLCADFSAIECRVLFWLCNEIEGLQIYRTHGLVYESMAADIYHRPIEEIKGGSFERQLGKQAVLGCGYQMGWKTFIVTCDSYGIEISEQESKMAVNAYRTKFKRVVDFWYETERCAVKAVLKPGETVVQNEHIRWKKVGDYLFCRLPSGRKIAYYDPQIQQGETPWGEPKDVLTFMGVDSKTKKWCRQKTYGGKLVENITQAVARDFMAEAMFREEAAGYKVILTVHDELLAENPEDFGSLKEFEDIMAEVPEWGEGCPIEVEGWEGKRFKK